MTKLYESFEDIDDELCLLMDDIITVREMLESQRHEDALKVAKDLEEKFEHFLEISDQKESEEEESEEEEVAKEGGEEGLSDKHEEDCMCHDCRQEMGFDEAVCKSLDAIAEAIKNLDDRLTAIEDAVFEAEDDREGSCEHTANEETEEQSEEDGDLEGESQDAHAPVDEDVGIWDKVGKLARQTG